MWSVLVNALEKRMNGKVIIFADYIKLSKIIKIKNNH